MALLRGNPCRADHGHPARKLRRHTGLGCLTMGRHSVHSSVLICCLRGEPGRKDGVEQSDEWATQRARYMPLEAISTASDTATVRLSAAPA